MFVEKSSGNKYTGDFLDGKKWGDGTLKFKTEGFGSEKVFTGKWKNNQMEFGELKTIDAGGHQVYLGQFLNEKFHGRGLMRHLSYNSKGQILPGDSYEGKWENGEMHGEGVYLYSLPNFEKEDEMVLSKELEKLYIN
jgi:hypothetical protein